MILRPACDDDSPALFDLLSAADLVDTRADVTDLLHAPGLDLATRSRVATEGGRIRGLALCHPAPQPGQLRAQLAAEPDVARTLLAFVRAWALADGAGPVTLFQPPNSPAAEALTEDGWTVVHSYTRLTADLADLADHQLSPLPAGLSIGPDDPATVHAVVEEAVAGHWNHGRRTFADFLADQESRAGHDPALWLLAEQNGLPAGAVICRAPKDRAWVAWLGVRPEFRGRGIAGALLAGAFARLADRGHDTVGVDVDTHNETGAVAVYRRAGLRVLGTADQWHRTYP